MTDLFSHLLRVDDVLGFHRGKNGPDARRLAIARGLLSDLEPKTLAAAISAASKRNFQMAAWLLDLIHNLNRSLFRRTAAAIDLGRLDRTIGSAWARPSHDLEILLAILSQDPAVGARVQALIRSNAARIELLPPRFALLCQDVGISHLEAWREIDLGHWSTFALRHGDTVVRAIHAERPDLVDVLLRPGEAEWAEQFSHKDPSFYAEGGALLAARAELSPASLQRLLDQVDVATATVGWRASLAKGGRPAKTVAYLIDGAIARGDAVGDLARDLRRRHPKASRAPLDR
jgi:hypothetical protein